MSNKRNRFKVKILKKLVPIYGVEVIKEYDNILNFVHLPIQSGSTRILKIMGRRYTKESYKELYDSMKKLQSEGVKVRKPKLEKDRPYV